MVNHTKQELHVLKRITPPARKPAIVAQMLKRVTATIKRQQVQATVQLGGSLAKGTYLKGDHDVDVFVRFAASYKDGEISDILERALHTTFTRKKVERVHGSRDYFHVQQGTFMFEFIPVLHISSWQEAVNVTDMSPLHVRYVRDHIDARPALAGEIRLTKQFCKAAKIYGAESYIGGFSGHVIDLLNIHYGGFKELLHAAATWPAKVIIDPEQHHDNPLLALNDAKTFAPLVIVDPIQPDRNSAAALTPEVFKRFKEVAKAYLDAAPSEQERFFTVLPLDIKAFSLAHPDALVIVVTLIPQNGKKDVVGAKCLKVYEYLMVQLLEHQFRILASAWEFTEKKTTVLIALPKEKLPAEQEFAGPPLQRTMDVERFKSIHKTTFPKAGRIMALERRKYRDGKTLILKLLQSAYVTERVKRASIK